MSGAPAKSLDEERRWLGLGAEPPLDAAIPIIDAHHHLWSTPPYPEFNPFPAERLAEERVRAGHNFRQTVYVDCSVNYRTHGPEHLRPVGEVEHADGVAQAMSKSTSPGENGICAAIIARADMFLGERADEVLAAHVKASPKHFRGIRHMTPWDGELTFYRSDRTPEMLRQPAFRQGVACLARRGMTFDAWVVHTQLLDVVDLARHVPDATIVLNHFGGPIGIGPYTGRQTEVFAHWRRGMAVVADCPNVVVKLGGFLMDMTALGAEDLSRPMTSIDVAEAIRGYALATIDLFTPERCMFESNFPVDQHFTSYGALWNGFQRVSAGFSESERKNLFAGTAARIYRIESDD